MQVDLTSKKLTSLGISIPQYARITQIKGRIFVTGGSSSKTVTEFDEAKKSLIPKADMIVGRQSS